MRVSRLTLLLSLFFGSGAAALGHQMVWVRLFAGGLGHEVPAMVSVAGAFLTGMALGAWCFDRAIARSSDPGGWLGKLELVAGGWSLLTAWLIPVMNGLALRLLGPQPSSAWHWTVVFALPFLTLLPATMAMGATLPAMERFLAPHAKDGRCVGLVYAINTFGAVAGTLGSVVLVMPWLGLRGGLVGFALLNGLVGIGVLRLRSSRSMEGVGLVNRAFPPGTSLSSRRLGLVIAGTGLLGMGYELVGIRALSQVLENTIYTFAATLAVYLMGTSFGAALYHRFLRAKAWRSTLTALLAGLALACVAGGWSLRGSLDLYDALRDGLGDSLFATLLAELVLAGTVFGAPTLLMGAIFSHLAQASRRPGGGLGAALSLNLLGCGVAAVVVTLALLPGLGLDRCFAVLAGGYVLLMPIRWRAQWWLPVVLLVVIVLVPGPGRILRLEAGSEVVEFREGVMSAAAVVKLPNGERVLRVNNRRQMGGTGAAYAQEREAHLPLLLHPRPRTALFLGPGTGITLGAATLHPGLHATGVELLPEVRALMRHFEPENHGPFPQPGIELVVADARRFVRTSTNRYDVIVADLFHPAQDGAGFLYTREHFAAIRQRLAAGGLFCQWLPLHQMDEQTLRVIGRTFGTVFSRRYALLLHFNVDVPVLGLIGVRDELTLDLAAIDERLADPPFKSAMRNYGLDRAINVLGCLAAGPELLEQLERDAEIATDSRPVVTFLAPRFAARQHASPHALLESVLEETRGRAEELLRVPTLAGDRAAADRLTDFWVARDDYLRGLMREAEGDLTGAVELYLASTKRSLYFTPAYARMVTVIRVMAGPDRARAWQWWQRLEEAQPDQPLGRRLLGPLFQSEDRGVSAPR